MKYAGKIPQWLINDLQTIDIMFDHPEGYKVKDIEKGVHEVLLKISEQSHKHSSFKNKNMKIRAKIQISSAFKNDGYEGEQIYAHAVYGNSTNAEDNTFSAATPSLHLQMSITNPAAIGQLQKGKKYYIDFTEAPE